MNLRRPLWFYLAAVLAFVLLAVITLHTGPFKAVSQFIMPGSDNWANRPHWTVLLHPLVVFANPGFGFGFVLGLGIIKKWRQILFPFLLLFAVALLSGLSTILLAAILGRAFRAGALPILAIGFFAGFGAPYSIAGAGCGFLFHKLTGKLASIRSIVLFLVAAVFSACGPREEDIRDEFLKENPDCSIIKTWADDGDFEHVYQRIRFRPPGLSLICETTWLYEKHNSSTWRVMNREAPLIVEDTGVVGKRACPR